MTAVTIAWSQHIQRVIEAGIEDDEDTLARDEPLLALLSSASLQGRSATGAHQGERWRQLGDRVEPQEAEVSDADTEASRRVPQHRGISLHAEVAVPARDRRRVVNRRSGGSVDGVIGSAEL